MTSSLDRIRAELVAHESNAWVHPSPLNFRWQSKNPWFEEEVVPALRSLVTGALAGT